MQQLRPAFRFLSILLIMLGTTLVLVAALALWLRAPEQVAILQLTEAATIVRGGEPIAVVLSRMNGEVLSAAALLLTGVAGLAFVRSDEPHPSWLV